MLSRALIDKLTAMVRPFDLRDLALVRRLGTQGVALHAVSALVDNLHPLRDALMSMVVGGEFPTYIWKQENGENSGFVQLRVQPSSSQAFILYVSPRIEPPDNLHVSNGNGAIHLSDSMWLSLLDHAVFEAGQRGIHSVVAEVDELAPELAVFRHAGFAVYTRQDIWQLTREDWQHDQRNGLLLERRQPSDDWDVQLLYANMVPRLVQLVEPMPLMTDGETWVLRDAEELTAFVHIHRGPSSVWMRFFIHPDAEMDAGKIVAAALDVAFQRDTEVVYCCVRRYESWLPSALGRSGFQLWASQAVMARHTVYHKQNAAPETSIALDTQRIPASSPLVRQYRKSAGHVARPRKKGREKAF